MEIYKIRGVVLVIFSVVTALTNLVLMTTILCTRQLRLSSKYILVLVLSTCDLITGVFLYTINADLLLNDGRQYTNCNFLNALYIYVPYILYTLRMYLMIDLFINFVLVLMIKDVKLLFQISLIMIACSIVTSFVLVFTMEPGGVFQRPDETLCLADYIDNRGLNVSTYFPQMVVLVFLCVTIRYLYSKHRTQFPTYDPANPPASPMDVIKAASIMVVFQFPQMVYLVIPGQDISYALFHFILCFDYSQTFVIPLVWFSNLKIRSAIMNCRWLLSFSQPGKHRHGAES